MKRSSGLREKRKKEKRERLIRLFIVAMTLFIVLLFVLSAIFVLVRGARAEDAVSEVKEWVGGAPTPVPQLTVESYALDPEILFPSDFGVLTVTLRNSQEKPIDDWKRSLDIKGTGGAEGSTETTFTLDAYVKEAYLVERDVEVFNSHGNAGVVGPDKSLSLNFKIQAPDAPGIYMVKFVANVEDTHGNAAKAVRYWIPVVVCSPDIEIILLNEFIQESEFLEVLVANCGVSEVQSVLLSVSVDNVQLEASKAFLGNIEAGGSEVARFKVRKVIAGGSCDAEFHVTFRNGANTHKKDFSLELSAVKGEEMMVECKTMEINSGMGCDKASADGILKSALNSLLRLFGVETGFSEANPNAAEVKV